MSTRADRGADIMRANLEAAAAGSPQPEPEFNQSVWARWDAMSPREQADGYLQSGEQLMAAFEGLADDARDDVRIPLGFLPKPADLATFTGLRLNEAALHSWDVRVVDDADAAISAEEADLALDLLTGPLSFMVGFLGKPDRLGVAEARLRVETTHPTRSLGVRLAPAHAGCSHARERHPHAGPGQARLPRVLTRPGAHLRD